MTKTLTPPLFAFLKADFKRDRKKKARVQLQKQVADLKRQLESLQKSNAAQQHEKQRHKMLNANPLCSCCGCEMTIRRKQKNTARLIDGKLFCESCIHGYRPSHFPELVGR